MISKELLSEVLGYKVKDIVLSTENNLCFFSCNVEHRINIHEIVHKCKEWAVGKGYTLVEAPLMLRITRLCTNQNKIWEYTLEEQNNDEYFKPEYTFKACEWIRTQIAS